MSKVKYIYRVFVENILVILRYVFMSIFKSEPVCTRVCVCVRAHTHCSVHHLSIIFHVGSFIHSRASALPSSSLSACRPAERGGRQAGSGGAANATHPGGKNQSLHNSEAEKLKMIFIFFIWRRIHYLAEERELSAVSQE